MSRAIEPLCNQFKRWIEAQKTTLQKPDGFIVGHPKDNTEDCEYLLTYINTFVNFMGAHNNKPRHYNYITSNDILNHCTMFMASWTSNKTLVYLSIHFGDECVAMTVIDPKYDIGLHKCGANAYAYAMAAYNKQWNNWVVQYISRKKIQQIGDTFEGFEVPDSIREDNNKNHCLYAFHSEKDRKIIMSDVQITLNAKQYDENLSTFDIWMEGFHCTGMDYPARATCEAIGVRANSFKEAVIKYYTTNGKLNSNVDLDRMTYWGCGLYPTEAEARRSFG